MILDGHIHLRHPGLETGDFLGRLDAAGVAGGIVISLPPPTFQRLPQNQSAQARLEHVLAWCAARPRLYPFFWIDPIDAAAPAQVEAAAARGIAGFKVICDRFPPGQAAAMWVYRAIATTGRPLLFHSGILWDGKASSVYNRPTEFEVLLDVPKLRFSLAHISWPWCDELVAVYGKFLNAGSIRPDTSVEMFVDTTPGTPAIYRERALANLFGAGYDVANNVWFGSDCYADAYNGEWVRQWYDRDTAIFRSLGLGEDMPARVFGKNLERFLGLTTEKVAKAVPLPAQ